MPNSSSRRMAGKFALVLLAVSILLWGVAAFLATGGSTANGLSSTRAPGSPAVEMDAHLAKPADSKSAADGGAAGRTESKADAAPGVVVESAPEKEAEKEADPIDKEVFLGRLVDRRDGAPIPFGKIRWITRVGAEPMTTDAEGKFSTGRAHPSGDYWIGNIESGYDDPVKVEHRVAVGDDPPARIDVRIPIGPTVPLDVDIPPGVAVTDLRAAIVSTVNFAYFDPCSADWATLHPGTPPWVRLSNEAVEYVGDVGPWRLAVGSKDGAWFGAGDLPAARGILVDPVRVELEPAASLRGRVIRQDGAPVDKAVLELNPLGDLQDDRASYRLRSDPEGAFLFPFIAPGSYELSLNSRSTWECAPQVIEIEAGRMATDVTLTVSPRTGMGSVSGTVTSDSGTFHGPVRLGIMGSGTDQIEWSEVDGAWVGTFTVENVPPGEHDAVVSVYPYFLRRTFARPKAVPPCTDFDIVIHDNVELFDLQFAPVDALTNLRIKEFEFNIKHSIGRHGSFSSSHVSDPSIKGFPEGEDLEWMLVADGYVAAYGDQNDLPREGKLRELKVPLRKGWGVRVQTWDVASRDPVPGISVYTDGSLAGTTGPNGILLLEEASRPDSLAIEHPDWRIPTGWGVDPTTGRFTEDTSVQVLGIALERQPK